MDEELDLTGLSDEDLAARLEQITAEAAELRSGDINDEAIARAESLAGEREAITAESDRRTAEAAERADRMNSALTRLGPDEEAEGEGDEEAEPDEVTPEETVGDEEVEPDAPTAAAPQAQAAATKRSTQLARTEPRVPSRLAAARPNVAKPKATKPPSFGMKASAYALGATSGEEFGNPLSVAQAIVKTLHGTRDVPEGSRQYVAIASGQKDIADADYLGMDPEQNFSILQSARMKGQEAALVATGGICAPQTPLYDFFRLAVPQSPIEDRLPTVGAPRGGIRYITPPNFADAAAGIGRTSAAQDLAGYVANSGPTANKPCVRVTCPAVQEKLVTAISQCVTFGNLQYRTFPEQVEAFLEDLAVEFALTKENYYQDVIYQASKAIVHAPAYGASRGLLWSWTTAAVEYRKRNNMARGSTLTILLPDHALDMIKLDMAMDAYNGLQFFDIPDSAVESAMRSRGLDPIWWNDVSSTGIAKAQSGGGATLNSWPAAVRAIIFAPGTFVRLDGGTLDVGLVRDSTLNKTNDLQLFMEEWTEVAMVGLESVSITATTCPYGAAPAGVTALTCASGSGV